MRQRREINKIASWLTGYDVFISYRHADAHKYAIALEKALEANGLMVFRDESEEGAGVPLEIFIKRACSTRTLVVLATPTVFESSNVLAEVSNYLSRRIDTWYRRPFSRVISVNVAQTLSNIPSEPKAWRRLSDFVYESETLEAIDNATPSADVVEKLTRASSFMKSWWRFNLIVGAVMISVLLSIIATSLYLKSVTQELSLKRKELVNAQRDSIELTSSNRLLNDQNANLKVNVDLLRTDSQKLTDANSILASENKGLITQSTELKENNSLLISQNNNLLIRADQLQKKTDDLNLQSTMLQTRNAAQIKLSQDPLIAYRLAVEAYRLKPEPANRKLIFSSLSKIDLFYKLKADGYSIEDFKEPFVLLSRKSNKDSSKDLFVFNADTLEIQSTNVNALEGWVVPHGKTWRLVAKDSRRDGSEYIVVYELRDEHGNILGEARQGGWRSDIEFLNDGKVSIPVYNEPKVLIWDLINNTKEFVEVNKPEWLEAGYYISLARRGDGQSAAKYKQGLVLIDTAGNIKPDTYVEAHFDSAFTRTKWSPDEKYLVLNDTSSKSLGIWNLGTKSFTWLDPDNWRTESYAWSHVGHLLAFSGRSVNDTDVTIEIVDASMPEQSRRIIYRGVVPIRRVVFLPGDDQLAVSDREGNIAIIQISTGLIFKKGRQEGIDQLFSAQGRLYSSSPDDFRVWSTHSAPAKHWLFQSSGERMYSPVAAADPTWNWLAVSFVEGEKTGGVELRKVRGDEKLELSVPKDDMDDRVGVRFRELQFSGDGKWLAIGLLRKLRIYNTSSWKYYDFTLHQDDGQFYTLKIVNNTLYAHASGKDWTLKKDGHDYIIKLDGDQPTFTGRVHSVREETKEEDEEDEEDEKDRTLILNDIDGWEFGNLYKYRGAGLLSSTNSGWAYYIKCRDGALGARDCDVQFFPRDLEKTINLYDSLLWKPEKSELKTWLKESLQK